MRREWYGRDGSFKGYKDRNRYYDAHGNYCGYYNHSEGKFYGSHGQCKGRVQQEGRIIRFYDAHGISTGYRDTVDGKRYDEHGQYLGRRDKDGRVYGKHGEYRGRSVARGGKSSGGGGIIGFFKRMFGR